MLAQSSAQYGYSVQMQISYLKVSCLPYLVLAEMQMNAEWSVGAGENSKEVYAQTQRTRREKETLSSRLQDIPPDPKEPWDLEMDFDDSLTPEIPTEQPPDADVEEGPSSSPVKQVDEAPATVSAPVTTTASAPSTSDGAPEPDLELLAVLLKNPDLVFALTSNQGKNLSSEEMVALLDMLKRNGVALTGMLNEVAQPEGKSHPESTPQVQEPPASLPSPTPPSEAARVRPPLQTADANLSCYLIPLFFRLFSGQLEIRVPGVFEDSGAAASSSRQQGCSSSSGCGSWFGTIDLIDATSDGGN